MFSAVLKYHKKSLLQAGVVDVHFTYGALETMSFAQQQEKHKQLEHKEVFVKVSSSQPALVWFPLLIANTKASFTYPSHHFFFIS